jgi:hypothetical protein
MLSTLCLQAVESARPYELVFQAQKSEWDRPTSADVSTVDATELAVMSRYVSIAYSALGAAKYLK